MQFLDMKLSVFSQAGGIRELKQEFRTTAEERKELQLNLISE